MIHIVVLKLGFVILDEWVIIKTLRKNNMYMLDLNTVSYTTHETCLISKVLEDESQLWQRILGHSNFDHINKLVIENHVICLPQNSFYALIIATHVKREKKHKVYHKIKVTNSNATPLKMLHIDLFGPKDVFSIAKKQCYLVVVDDSTRFTWVCNTNMKL